MPPPVPPPVPPAGGAPPGGFRFAVACAVRPGQPPPRPAGQALPGLPAAAAPAAPFPTATRSPRKIDFPANAIARKCTAEYLIPFHGRNTA